ncbi:MAG: DUF3545 family protein [Aeromonas sp.]
MEMFQFEEEVIVTRRASRGRASKKCRWREIEMLKEKRRLQQELADMDVAYDELLDIDLRG